MPSSLALGLAALPPGRTPDPIPPGCPWHELSAYGLPNVNWCEAPLCAYVGEPANAWSNLAYVLVALAIALVQRGERSPLLRRFAAAVATVGVCSFAYHASNVHVTQILDFFGGFSFGAVDFGCSWAFFGSASGSGASSGALTSALIGRSALTLSHRTGMAALRPVGYAVRGLAD